MYHDIGVTRNKIVTAQFECYQKIMKDSSQDRRGRHFTYWSFYKTKIKLYNSVSRQCAIFMLLYRSFCNYKFYATCITEVTHSSFKPVHSSQIAIILLYSYFTASTHMCHTKIIIYNNNNSI